MTNKSFLVLLLLGMVWNISSAQIKKPVTWSYDSKHVQGNQYDLIFKAKIDEGWNIYSQYLESDDGPVKTSFTYEEPTDLKMIGKNKEESPKRKEGHDKLFDMNVIKFQKSCTFTQRVEVKDPSVPIKGYLEFMVCDAKQCLPPTEKDFVFNLPAKAAPKPTPTQPTVQPPKPTSTVVTSPKPTVKPKPVPTQPTVPKKNEVKEVEKPKVPKKEKVKKEVKKETVKTEKKEEKTSTSKVAGAADEEDEQEESSGLLDPVKWSYSTKKLSGNEYEVSFNAKLDEGWSTYTQFIDADPTQAAPSPTYFEFNKEGADNFQLQGKIKEVSDHKVEGKDPIWENLHLVKYKKAVSFVQKLKVKDTSKPLEGFFEYMTCDKKQCLPPTEVDFSIDFSKENENVALGKEIANTDTDATNISTEGFETAGVGTPIEETFDKSRTGGDCSGREEAKVKRSYWQTFIKGILGGLIALLTPCVFPMIPLTVSYFLKGGKDKKKGFRDAIIYGLSIIILYTGLGTVVTMLFGPSALNNMSSDPWFNLGLAVLLIVFAFSFFGFFEIQLPSKWADKTDRVADKGGIIGILAMAATLALVSFSCTGPLIGVLLVDAVSGAANTGVPIAPIIGMFGFSISLALPFALFAAFPSWLSSLPKSGGWMDDVKTSVGFIELALSLKFLAVFSLIMEHRLGFKVLTYEVFVGLWVIIAILWGLYFLNLFRFKKDPYASKEKKKIPIGKVVLGVLLLGLAAWNMTGFRTTEFGSFKPTSLMSGLAPPSGHSWIYPVKCPHNLNCYHDYYVAKQVAIKENKPLFLDFTGYSCENCRKNEESIWPHPDVISKLRDNYIVVSLYVDDKTPLETPYVSKVLGNEGKKRKEGHKWADFQVAHMGSNSQPLYVLGKVNKDNTVTILNKPVGGLVTDADEYAEFLQCGLDVFEELKGQ